MNTSRSAAYSTDITAFAVHFDACVLCGTPPEARGHVFVGTDGSVELELTECSGRFYCPPEQAAICAQTSDGFTLSVTKAYRNSLSMSAGERGREVHVAYLVDELLLSKVGPHLPWTRKRFWVCGPNVAGTERWSWNSHNFVIESRDGFTLVTMNGFADDASSASITEAVFELLSLASRVMCQWFLEETFIGDDCIERRAAPRERASKGTNPLIPIGHVATFMSQTMSTYCAQRETWSLRTLIVYYCRSHNDSLAEAKFIFAGVIMEAVKFYWAKNVGKLTQDTKSNGLIRGFPKQGGRHYAFEELLTMAASSLGLDHSYTFLDDRNALFHTGLPSVVQTAPGSPTWPPLKDELTKVHDQIDDILLTIIAYQGLIHSFWEPNKELQFPGRT